MIYNGKPYQMDDLGVPLFLETSKLVRALCKCRYTFHDHFITCTNGVSRLIAGSIWWNATARLKALWVRSCLNKLNTALHGRIWNMTILWGSGAIWICCRRLYCAPAALCKWKPIQLVYEWEIRSDFHWQFPHISQGSSRNVALNPPYLTSDIPLCNQYKMYIVWNIIPLNNYTCIVGYCTYSNCICLVQLRYSPSCVPH